LSKEQLLALEKERNDLSYRTGKVVTLEEFQKALMKEQWFAGQQSLLNRQPPTEYDVVRKAAFDGTLHNLWKGNK